MSRLSFLADLAGISAGHAWTDEKGRHHATVDLTPDGRAYVDLNSVADALLAAAAEAKANLLRLEAEAASERLPAGDGPAAGTGEAR